MNCAQVEAHGPEKFGSQVRAGIIAEIDFPGIRGYSSNYEPFLHV
jgi:hypothetical protein